MRVSRRAVIAGGSCVIGTGALARVHGGTANGSLFGFYNFTGSNMSAYQAAVAAARNAIVLCTGDSITAGVGATNDDGNSNAKSLSYPTQLAGILTNGSWSSFVANNHLNPLTYDSRITYSNWASDFLFNTLTGFSIKDDSPNTDALAFTPTNSVDTFDIYYFTLSGGGTFTLDLGGSILATVPTNSGNSVSKQTVTGSLAAHTLNIKRSSGGSIYIFEVVAYNSASKEITILNAGGAGQFASNFVSTSDTFAAGSRIAAIAPDLGIALFGTNDWNAGTGTSTFTGYLQTQITNLLNSGNVILMSDPPSDPNFNASLATQAAYVAAMNALAVSNGIGFIDVWNLFGGSWATANARGWMYDGLHPNSAGYAQIAGFVKTALANGFVSQ